MESKKFFSINNRVYQQFQLEYKHSPILNWRVFILQKDIGIDAIGEKFYYIWEFEYIVTDEKKWFLSKLKYGI